MKEAIEFVMKFYHISFDDAVNYYWDEVEAYMRLSEKLKEVEE
jgi:DNA primase